MGGTSYSYMSAMKSRSVKGTATNSIDDNFKQNKLGRAHETMKSQGIDFRESRDSEVHPETFPIIISLDVTGSMGHIPEMLIKEGLPELISDIIKGGVTSPAVLFLAIGDHAYDIQPLQVGQFESGDKELDMWLERTWLEGHGGGNNGESYSLAHYFAAHHTITDSWEKRKQKGILITIGDEPNLDNYSHTSIKEVMGNTAKSTEQGFNAKSLLELAQEKWEVFHIDVRGGLRLGVEETWGHLGQHYIKRENNSDVSDIPKLIAQIVLDYAPKTQGNQVINNPSSDSPTTSENTDTDNSEVIL